ncbi:MAG: SAM-dependent methyltransferase [Nitrosomonas sp.]|nr:SAM-dependent methyltransferase [Nitrosomonas sp.]
MSFYTPSSNISNLPACSDAALAHSRKLQAVIREEIAASGGWISFARYMELALYYPGLGYYNGGATKLGGSGDFVTAPEVSTLFGSAVARQVKQISGEIAGYHGKADVLEIGAGSGKLARDMLRELEQSDCLPQHYYILEVSAELRERQRKLLIEHTPHLMPRVTWLERLPEYFVGTILANEVIDAMPVHLVEWRGNDVLERGVVWQASEEHEQQESCGKFTWQNRPIANDALKAVTGDLTQQINPQRDPDFMYGSEINQLAGSFICSLAGMLQQGAVILIDYGFGRGEYYHPQRNQGTLMCHYRHHAHGDPFYLPGLQDITSHVDFSALYAAAEDAGLSLLGYTTQAHFLLNCGITEILSRTPVEDVQHYLPLTGQLQKLISPAEMGELFKVIAFGKSFDPPLDGFVSGDKSRML